MTDFHMSDFDGEETIDVGEVFNELRDDWASDAVVESRPSVIVPKPEGLGFFELRPYQNDAVNAVYDEFEDEQSTLLVLPTGCGKTVCFAEISLRWPDDAGRVLVVAHREELIDQASEKIGLHLDEITGIEMGDRHEIRGGMYGSTAKVLVASVQTLTREKRRGKFKPEEFGLIIVDEAHHSSAKSYKTVLSYFLQNPRLKILGVTATPKRADGKAMAEVYQTVSYQMTLLNAIDEGWLVDVEQKVVVVEGLDFSKCRTTAGDMNERDLVNQMMGGTDHKIESTGELTPLQIEQIQNQERMLHAVVSPTIKESQGRPTLVFCVTKAHAERMTEVFRRHPGITAEYVTDDTSKDDRRDIVEKFKAGLIQILVGVGVFTEGFDSRVDVVVIARPTKSESLYIQMVGRGTRPLPGLVDRYNTASERREAIANSAKPAMTVLDFVGTSANHDICSMTDILGGDFEEDVIQAAKDRLRNGETAVVTDLLDQVKDELNAEKEKKRLAKAEREAAEKERQEALKRQQRLDASKRTEIRADATYTTKSVGLQRVVIPEQVGVGVFRGGASDPQVKLLMRLGISEKAACGFTRGQAGKVIDERSNMTGGDYIMRFGKHMGSKIKELPSGYLDWAQQNMTDPAFKTNYAAFKQGKPNE